ncbi:MAG: hypothetical protein ACREJC_18265 [Tepidisphaeraceae bacterium]
MTSRRVLSGGLIGFVFATSASMILAADMGSVAGRLPKATNTVLAVDMTKLCQSPLGKSEDLTSRMASGYADRPLPLPGTTRQVAIGAYVHPAGLQTIWQAAVVDLSGRFRMEPVLAAQGGYMDKIAGKLALWTPRDVYNIELDANSLGVLRPGDRQFANRWLSSQGGAGLSNYLSSALSSAGNDGVFAIDLENAVGDAAVRYALSMGQLPSLEKIEAGQDKLVAAIGSVKGATMTMRFTDRIECEWTVEFAQSIAALSSVADQFVVDVLTAADLYQSGAEKNWQFKAEGSKLVGKGSIDFADFARLTALLSPTDRTMSADVPTGAAPQTSAQPAPSGPQNAAVASQKYYRAVSKTLDSIGVKASPNQGASWFIAQSRQIQQLSILNVDPALIEWGNMVGDAFNRAAQELAVGQQKAQIAAQGIASPTASVHTDDYSTGGSTADTAESRAAFRNAQQQRRQVAQTERGAAGDRAFSILNELLPSRGQIRAQMTQKYGVEF